MKQVKGELGRGSESHLFPPPLTAPTSQNPLIMSGGLSESGGNFFKPLEWWNPYLCVFVRSGKEGWGKGGGGRKEKERKTRQKRGKASKMMKVELEPEAETREENLDWKNKERCNYMLWRRKQWHGERIGCTNRKVRKLPFVVSELERVPGHLDTRGNMCKGRWDMNVQSCVNNGW